MKDHGGGSIVNVSSTAGINAGVGLIAYRSMKAAVIHASKNIAIEVAQYGIRVNCIVPGQIATAMNEGSYDLDQVMTLTQPLPRAGRPDDVAEAALFLASDRSAQITGVTLPVDGGTTTGPPAAQLKLLLQSTKPPE
jgi:NAD(P)-dependent dehydrogenase (short-subunit alcohol dehydrogenase family)